MNHPQFNAPAGGGSAVRGLPAPARGGTVRRHFLLGGMLTAVFGLMFWLGGKSDGAPYGYSVDAPPTDYYNMLTDGFLSGHLYLKTEPHPGLLSPDPAVRRTTPTLLDAGFFQGHFYLYYGITPAVLAFLPYTWATGRHLSPNLVTLLFVATGFLYALAVLRAVARAHSALIPSGTGVMLVLLLAFASGTPALLMRSMFYELPVAAGYACMMGLCWHLYRALTQPVAGWWQLATASLWLGLAVGCRPNYILVLPLLPLAAWFLCQRRASTTDRRPSSALFWAGALLPAALIGAGLAAYNWARFGSIFEFGFRYGQNEFFSTQDRLMSPAFIWPNLRWYYFTPPGISPYFPYIFPLNGSFLPKGYHGSEAVHGQMAFTLLVTFVGVSALIVWWRARCPAYRRHVLWLGPLAWIFVTSLGFMALLGIRANRYMVDFHAALVLGVALVAGLLAARLGRWWRFGLAALTAMTVSFNLLVALQQFDEFSNRRPQAFHALAALGDRPSAWAAQLGLLHYGPLLLQVVFPVATEVSIQPLLAIGTPGYSDSLCVVRQPGHLVEFMLDHSGYGGPKSALLSIEPGRIHEITLDFGALYPPLRHPFFAGFTAPAAKRLKSAARVTLDGVVVLDARMPSYDAPPWSLQAGRDHITDHGFKAEFDGTVLVVGQRPVDRPRPDPGLATGLWRLRCTLPLHLPGTNHSLLASGVTGAGNMLYLKILPDRRFQFAFDQWGIGASLSPALSFDSAKPHVIECFIGPHAARQIWQGPPPPDLAALQQSAHTLRIWLDGQPVWSTPVWAHPDSYRHMAIGANPQGFSSASAEFTGEISLMPYLPTDARDFLLRNLRLAGEMPPP